VHSHNAFKERHRAATVNGSGHGTALGSTADAFLPTSTEVVERR
jgi:hypothetical protein